MTFDILIKNGTILDGVSNEGYLADIGISGQEIKAIGNLTTARAKRIILGDDKYIAPGFIDIQNHSDSYLTLLEIPLAQSLVSQGITTIAVGHCGTSLAPLAQPEALKSVQKWHSLSGANLNWLNFAEYLQSLQNYPLGVNVLSLVGHSTLRRGLLGDEVREATPEEIEIMSKLLTESLDQGGAGLSLGLIYAHEVDASKKELLEITKLTAKRSKLLSVHLRSESSHLLEALNEVLELAESAGTRLKISHFKIQGRQNWAYFEEALSVVDRAYQRGVKVFFDVYPYTTSWTVLYTYLPKWSYEGGRKAILQNLKDNANRSRILSHLRSQDLDLGNIFIATSETNPALIGKTLRQIAANQEVSNEEALVNVLIATQAQVVVFDHNLSEGLVESLLKHPLSVIATDGAGYDLNFSLAHGLVHPRCFGTMPKFLAMVRDKKLMPWPQAIKKITSRPAEALGLKQRGQLAAGSYADIVIFDPRDTGSRASYENPYQEASGIEYVLVNGKVAYDHNEAGVVIPAGKVLRV